LHPAAPRLAMSKTTLRERRSSRLSSPRLSELSLHPDEDQPEHCAPRANRSGGWQDTPSTSEAMAPAALTKPPLSKHTSVPHIKAKPMVTPKRTRPRFFSEDLHTKARRFGTPVTVVFTTNPETCRKQVEVVVHMSHFKRDAAPLVFVMELRRLLFWAVLCCFCTSASAFRAVPGHQLGRSSTPQMNMAARAAAVSPTSSLDASAGMLPQVNWPNPQMHRHILDEVSNQLGAIGENFGADAFETSAVASQLMSLVSGGEVTVDRMKVYFTRACLSAAMHKVVGTGLTLTACLTHAT